MALGVREAGLKAMREANFAKLKHVKPSAERLLVAKAAVDKSNTLSNTKKQSNKAFDKSAYQRDYMRKLRAEKKAT